MKLAVELYAEKPLFVKEGSFFKIGLRIRGLVMEDTAGTDYYKIACAVLSGKRVAGAARQVVYDQHMFPAGLGSGEARPGSFVELEKNSLGDMAVVLETNVFLDPGLLRDSLCLRFVTDAGRYDIPLARPDIEVVWDGRGRYVIPIGEFVLTKIFLEY